MESEPDDMRTAIEKINSMISDGQYSKVIKYLSQIGSELDARVVKRYLDYCRFKSRTSSDERSPLINGDGHDCVCVNTTVHEIAKLEGLFRIWGAFHQTKKPESKYFPHLVVAFDVYDARKMVKVRDLISQYEIEDIFLSVRLISVSVPNHLNFYKRVVDGSVELDKAVYGYKSGPNYQFFTLMRILAGDGYDQVYLCETDTFPLHAGWATSMFAEARQQKPFWVLGSPFLGRSKLDPAIALHINGSAIYSVSDPEFLNHLDRWESTLLKLVPEVPHIAYDWAMDYHFFKSISRENWGQLSHEDFHDQINYKKMCRFTDSILNFAGEAERAGDGRYAIDEILEKYGNACIVHGDYFYDELLERLVIIGSRG